MKIEDTPDHVRTYTPEEEQQLFSQLRALTVRCHANELWPPGVETLRFMHRSLFDGVRGHAGKFRARSYGDEHLVFGPNRSVHRDLVASELDDVFVLVDRSVSSLQANREDPSYERVATHLAIWAHAEVIRIHPFMDGNGRTSRLLMNSLRVGLQLRPVAVDVVKQEYNEALNRYFRERKRTDAPLAQLEDLILRLVDAQQR